MGLINTRTIIGVLIALVVGVPVLAAIFSSGGGVDNLNQLAGGGYCETTGSDTFASSAFDSLTFTTGGATLRAIPDGLRVPKGPVALAPYSVTTTGAPNRSTAATWGIGTYPYAAFGTSTAITCGTSAVAADAYATGDGNIGLTAFVPNSLEGSSYQPIIVAIIGLAFFLLIVAAVIIIANKARR